MNETYWFTDSYRKKAAKFQNNLLNEGKVTFPRVDCCRARSYVRRGTRPVVFKIITYERCMSERWNVNAHLPSRRLQPNYPRDGSRCDLAPRPCAFRPLQCYLT